MAAKSKTIKKEAPKKNLQKDLFGAKVSKAKKAPVKPKQKKPLKK